MALLLDNLNLKIIEPSIITNLTAQEVYVGADKIPLNYFASYPDFYVKGGEAAATVDSGITIQPTKDLVVTNVKCVAGVPILIIFNCTINMPSVFSILYASRLSGTADAFVAIGKRTDQPFLAGGGGSVKTRIEPAGAVVHVAYKPNSYIPDLSKDPAYSYAVSGQFFSAYKEFSYTPLNPYGNADYTVGAVVYVSDTQLQATTKGPAMNLPVRIAFPFTPTVTEIRDFNLNIRNGAQKSTYATSNLWASKVIQPSIRIIA